MFSYKKIALIIASILILWCVIIIVFHGTFLPKKYLSPWETQYHSQFDDPRIQIISHGILAPNAHNMQSWAIHLDENNVSHFDLYMNPDRLLPATDPYHRQLMISQGTFLELIKIASNKLWYKADIILFPKWELSQSPSKQEIQETPIASVYIQKDIKKEHPLYSAIFHRVTTRTNYLDTRLTKEQIDTLSWLNNEKDLQLLVFQDTQELSQIKKLAIEWVDIESSLDSTMKETNLVLRYNEYQKNKYRYGITLSSQWMPQAKQIFIEGFSSIFPLWYKAEGDIWRQTETKNIEKTPAYMMIISDKNDRNTQVRIGMLYARIQLAGTNLGLSMQPTMQITQEFDEMKNLYNQVTSQFAKNNNTVQMLFRIGKSDQTVEHSPRMDVLDIID